MAYDKENHGSNFSFLVLPVAKLYHGRKDSEHFVISYPSQKRNFKNDKDIKLQFKVTGRSFSNTIKRSNVDMEGVTIFFLFYYDKNLFKSVQTTVAKISSQIFKNHNTFRLPEY